MRPPAQLLAWVEQTLGSSARVVGWERLTGGLTSIVHGLTVERNGRHEEYVLRWWMLGSEWEQWIARAVERIKKQIYKNREAGVSRRGRLYRYFLQSIAPPHSPLTPTLRNTAKQP